MGRVSGRRRTWTRLAAALVLAVYAAAYSPHWWIGKDAALYLNLARNLTRGEGYALGGQPHTFVPPGLPLVLAGLMKLGLGGFWALNALAAAGGLATVLLAWRMFRRLVHRDWALLLAAVLALTREMVQRSGEVLTDIPTLLMVTGAIWLYLRPAPGRDGRRRWPTWEIGSVLLIAPCWFRLAAAPAAVGAASGLLVSNWRRARARALLNVLLVAAGLAATLGLFALYYRAHHAPGAASYAHRFQRLSAGVLGALASFYASLGDVSRLYIGQKMPPAICAVLLAVPVLVAMVRRARRGEWVTPLVVFCYVGAVAVASEKIRTRYLLPIFPLLLLHLLDGWAYCGLRIADCGSWIRRRRAISLGEGKRELGEGVPGGQGTAGRAAAHTAMAVLAVVLGMNLPLVGRLIYEKRRGDFPTAQQHGQWRYLGPTAAFLASQPGRGNMLAPQPLSFLADRPAPMLSRSTLLATPGPDATWEVLRRWRIEQVVFDDDSRDSPFLMRVRAMLLAAGPPVFTCHDAEVFRVPDRPPAAAPTRPGG